MCVFMFLVHGHCGPLGPYPGPHTSWWWWGGGGFVVAVLGGLVGLGAGTAFVGRAVVVVGGVSAFWAGGSPRRRFRRTTRKKTFVSWGRVGGG